MTTQIITSLQKADRVKGLTVVIDVLRAFTTTCYLFANGARNVLSVADLNDAYTLKKKHPSYLLIGERNGITPPGFDWDNSPARLQHISLCGKNIIFTTTAGTLGLQKAFRAEEIITGAFVNARAVVQYLASRKPSHVTFLCTNNRYANNEDVLCARYIRSLLYKHPINFRKIQVQMQTHPSADGFLHHPLKKWSKKDFDLSMSIDTFDFVVRAKKGTPIILERV